MTANEALELALELSGFSEVPADSGVLVPGELGQKVLFAIDVGVAELFLAKELGASGVIAHHPPGGLPRLKWHEVLWRHAELLLTYGVPETEARKAAGSWCGNLQLGTTRPTTGMCRSPPGHWASP